MAVTHTIAQRNELCNLVVDHIDDGTAGKLVIRLTGTADAVGTEVATLTFSAVAFDAAGSAGGNADGVATADTITDDSSATGNATDVSTATLEASTGAVAAHCTVSLAAGGGDIEATSLGIAATDKVSCSSLTYEAAN